ncbi:hypothetical protein AVEN_232545-1 [Araneus ventricosus]|uniref:Uncharacterized protein n=1 Tax=Araneus ventricosus TaxID=182803 RepID=A0A4Y2SC38_ARAVE|nr:hypothetical protein AVEN_193299-1 [Araneus ventricosus]GBN85393.1 hypothetical protein AVEN_232545-1 [Araneus ventricosus]
METFSTAANPAATGEEHMATTSSTVEFFSLTTTVSGVVTEADKREDTAATSIAVECTTLEESEVINSSSNLASNDSKHMEERKCDIDLKDIGQWPNKIKDSTRILLVLTPFGPTLNSYLIANRDERVRTAVSFANEIC